MPVRGRATKRSTNLPWSSGYRLTVVKDLSELRDQDRAIVRQMSDAVCGEGGREDVFLVAANDGQLVEAWNEVDSSTVVDVRALSKSFWL